MHLGEPPQPSGEPPPPYRSASWLTRSESLTHSASNVIGNVLSNVGLSSEANLVPYQDSEPLCSICLDAMDEEKGNLYTVPNCSHTFHKPCIARWKKESRKCPCCRGYLPDEIGPTMSELQIMFASFSSERIVPIAQPNVPIQQPFEESVPELTQTAVRMNWVLSPIGIIYPIFLSSLFIVFDTAFVGCLVVVIFFMALYYAFDQGENILCGIRDALIVIVMFPVIICPLVIGFVFQILYILYSTVKFYTKALKCKLRWYDAYRFIIVRTMGRFDLLEFL